MKKKQWIQFQNNRPEGSPVKAEIVKSISPLPIQTIKASQQLTTLTLHYEVAGIWHYPIQNYTAIDIPGTTHTTQKGYPSVPKDDLFIALPENSSQIKIKVIEKKVLHFMNEINLAPQPNYAFEKSIEEVYEPNTDAYEMTTPYPGYDSEYIGLKKIEGLKVAHIAVYLGQYQPKAKMLELVHAMRMEISYTTPPEKEERGIRKPQPQFSSKLILGIDMLNESFGLT